MTHRVDAELDRLDREHDEYMAHATMSNAASVMIVCDYCGMGRYSGPICGCEGETLDQAMDHLRALLALDRWLGYAGSRCCDARYPDHSPTCPYQAADRFIKGLG